METPGLWFIGKCHNPHCPLFSEPSALLIGCNRTFDFEKESKLCMCGACGQRVASITKVAFVNCCWSYQGVAGGKEEVGDERTTNGLELFPAEKQSMTWDWLRFTVDTCRPAKETQTSTEKAPSQSLEAQTEFIMLTLPELSPQLPGGVISNEVVDTLVARTKRYRTKYRLLKRAYGCKKTKHF